MDATAEPDPAGAPTVGAAVGLTDQDARPTPLNVIDCLACFDFIAKMTSEAILVHRDEDIVYANAASAELLGASSAEEIRGRRMGDFVPLAQLSRLEERRGLLRRGLDLPVDEFLLQGLDGSERTVRVSSRPVVHEGHAARLVVVRDVTTRVEAEAARTRLEAQLSASQRLESIGRLAGGVAHDFNNLLTVISGHTQLALSGLSPTSDLQEHLVQIDQATERAASLTRQLLAFGRQQVLRPSVVDLNEVVGGMKTMLRRLIRSEIRMSFDLRADACPVEVDKGQLEQVLVNLVANARDSIEGRGEIIVATESNRAMPESHHSHARTDCHSVLTVRDTGTGMDEQTLSRIFEPFFTTKGVGRGTGLGLATVYGIVKQSGGLIDVESRPGAGTVFRIWLPRPDAEST